MSTEESNVKSPHIGEDRTDSVVLIKRDVHALHSHEKSKQKAEVSHQIGKCRGLKRRTLVDTDSKNLIICDEVKVQQVKFYIISRNISKISAEGIYIYICNI